MAYVETLSSAFDRRETNSKAKENFGKDHSLKYLTAFVVLGLFFSMMSVALTPPEWLLEPAIWASA